MSNVMSKELFNDGLRELDEMIANNQEMVKLGESAAKLIETDEWKEVIEDAYFTGEAERLPSAIMNIDNVLNREVIDNMIDAMKAIRVLKQFMAYKLDDAIIGRSNIEQLRKDKEKWAADYAAAKRGEAIVDGEVVDVDVDDSAV